MVRDLRSFQTISKITLAPELPKLLSPIRIPVIPRKTPTHSLSESACSVLRSRRQTPSIAQQKNARVLQALYATEQAQEPRQPASPSVVPEPPSLDTKEELQQLQQGPASRPSKSREATSRSGWRGGELAGGGEGASQPDYSHSGVYSLQEA